MTEITDVANELKTILSVLADVDVSSIDDYEPAIKSKKAALIIAPFEQLGTMQYAELGRYSVVHAHRIICEFWIKVAHNDTPAAMQTGRDICLQALRLIAANPTLNGTVRKVGSTILDGGAQIGTYDILPRYEGRSALTYIVARLFVPVELREVATW